MASTEPLSLTQIVALTPMKPLSLHEQGLLLLVQAAFLVGLLWRTGYQSSSWQFKAEKLLQTEIRGNSFLFFCFCFQRIGKLKLEIKRCLEESTTLLHGGLDKSRQVG